MIKYWHRVTDFINYYLQRKEHPIRTNNTVESESKPGLPLELIAGLEPQIEGLKDITDIEGVKIRKRELLAILGNYLSTHNTKEVKKYIAAVVEVANERKRYLVSVTSEMPHFPTRFELEHKK